MSDINNAITKIYASQDWVLEQIDDTTATLIGDTSVSEQISNALSQYVTQEQLDSKPGEVVTTTITNEDGSTTTNTGERFNFSNNTASGNYSHAEGLSTTASGDYSHAEGSRTTASHQASHAEGLQTTASHQASHAEGRSTTASGQSSHAEGISTVASGLGAHAEGYGTEASGSYSHAEGSSTIATMNYQHVQGQYNVEVSNAAHIVGNGESNTARSNAHTLDWDGNAWFQGTITLGGTGQDDAPYEVIAVPKITEADNGKVLMVVNGQWQLVTLNFSVDENGVISLN